MSSKAYFEEIAPVWDNMRSDFFPVSVRERAISEIDVQPGIKVADIGAGSGFITEGLIEHDIEITAVDESENMIEVMKEKFRHDKNVHYLISESENLQTPDQSWDYALANMFLHHVERPAVVLKELYRTLKPGGKLIITDLDKHNFEFLVTEQNDRWMGFERSDIQSWFEEAGFKNVIIDCVNANCCADSCDSDDRAEINIFIVVGEK